MGRVCTSNWSGDIALVHQSRYQKVGRLGYSGAVSLEIGYRTATGQTEDLSTADRGIHTLLLHMYVYICVCILLPSNASSFCLARDGSRMRSLVLLVSV